VSARHGARDFVSQKLAKEDTARISKLRRIIMIIAILVALAIVAIRLAGATLNEAVLETVAEVRNRICGLHIDLIRKENCNVKTYESVVGRYLSNILVFKRCFVELGSTVRRWRDALWWRITRDYAVYW